MKRVEVWRSEGACAVVVGMLLTAALVGGCRDGVETGGRPEQPNILLVSIDTLRADHLGCYGHERDTSPVLDELAGRSIRFTDALAPTPRTLTSHAALLTGLHPFGLGFDSRKSALPPETRTLAELLQGAGYRTGGIVDSTPHGYVGSMRGFGRGFDSYAHLTERDSLMDMEETAARAIEWLENVGDESPFFLFLHTKAVHGVSTRIVDREGVESPYLAPEPYHSRFLEPGDLDHRWVDPEFGVGVRYLQGLNRRLATGEILPEEVSRERIGALERLYDGGIAYVDHHLGRILESLERAGLAASTVVLVTADHGEGFLEHYSLLHREVYRSVLHIPLILYLPWDPRPQIRDDPVNLLDVAPTLLELAGLAPEDDLDGVSLLRIPWAAGEGSPERRLTFMMTREYTLYEGWAIREGNWTVIRNRLGAEGEFTTEVFDRRLDPTERAHLTPMPAEAATLLEELERWRIDGPRSGGRRIQLEAETTRRLRALGYIR